ncbi:hypothetical protein ACS5PK_21700 [Roseateles sp. DB2]|uniref:hypothetical protein n=1 Tax=Roseateles sp. DB2 TaxID=3453717 RepID=UPI003EE8A4E3
MRTHRVSWEPPRPGGPRRFAAIPYSTAAKAQVFVEFPFRDLAGPYAGHAQPLPPEDDQRAGRAMDKSQLTVSPDNHCQ